MSSSKHAKFSPSSAFRWIECTASLEAKPKEKKQSSAAARGTRLHEIAEAHINQNGLIVPNYKIKTKNVSVHKYLNYVTKFNGWNWYVEKKVYVSSACYGTADFIAEKNGELYVVDLKTGNIPVDPKENTQLMIYAIGAIKFLGSTVTRIRLVIVQHGEVKVWKCSLKKLKDLEKKVDNIINDAKLVYKPSDRNCRWCPARENCQAYQTFKINELIGGF